MNSILLHYLLSFSYHCYFADHDYCLYSILMHPFYVLHILFVLDLLYLILFNLGVLGEPFADVSKGEAMFETPIAAKFEWGAGDVADHLVN